MQDELQDAVSNVLETTTPTPAEQDTAPLVEQTATDHEADILSEMPAAETTDAKPQKDAKDKAAQHAAMGAALKHKAETLEKELTQTKDTLLRTAAEYDNFRKRSAKERDAAFGNGLGFAVEKLLPVLDTLALAADAVCTDESYKKGVLLTMDQCREVFEKLEVAEIEAVGRPFDPELHAAVLQQPAPDGTEPGSVLQVLQKGYRYQDKVLRHATVIVAE